jgi:CrcB protein
VLTQISLVAVGGAIGSLARWGVGLLVARVLGTAFPWGTFVINLSGCMFLGWFATAFGERLTSAIADWIRPDNLRLMVAVGFTGAYTTFSTFEFEANGMFSDGNHLTGLTYLIGSVFLGLLGLHFGSLLARWL